MNTIQNRHVAVIINPISGRKQSLSLFNKYLKPALDITQVSYEVFTTESETWVEEWIRSEDSNQFTEAVLIGGDGLFSQFINAAYSNRSEWIKKPIGILPGGT